MRLSKYFLPVLKEVPAEATILSHRLMLRSGMIKQAAAGIYSWGPLQSHPRVPPVAGAVWILFIFLLISLVCSVDFLHILL